MENLDLEESSDYSDMAFDKKLCNSKYSEENFMICYGNLSEKSIDMWKIGRELYDDEKTFFSGYSSGINHQYQVFAIIDDNLEELDSNNNPIINPANVRRDSNHMAEGDTTEFVAARVRVQLQ
jgi:hypothetical protein